MLRQIFLLGIAIGSFGCGQSGSGNDAGPDGEGLDVITSGCFNGSSQSYPFDASACEPQLQSSYSCNGSICSWSVIIPCTAPSDAGADADADADAGVLDCNAICKSIQPPGPHPSPGFCQPFTDDAGTTISCGGCGI